MQLKLTLLLFKSSPSLSLFLFSAESMERNIMETLMLRDKKRMWCFCFLKLTKCVVHLKICPGHHCPFLSHTTVPELIKMLSVFKSPHPHIPTPWNLVESFHNVWNICPTNSYRYAALPSTYISPDDVCMINALHVYVDSNILTHTTKGTSLMSKKCIFFIKYILTFTPHFYFNYLPLLN